MKCVISLPKGLKILPGRAGEVDWSCRAQQLVPSTYAGWFTRAITLAPEDPMLFCLLRVPEHTCAYIHTKLYIYINLTRHKMKQCWSRVVAQREGTCIACTKWCVLSPSLQRKKGLRQYHSVFFGHVAVLRIAPLIISCRLQPVGVLSGGWEAGA